MKPSELLAALTEAARPLAWSDLPLGFRLEQSLSRLALERGFRAPLTGRQQTREAEKKRYATYDQCHA